jgi:alkaline phosphatase D
MGGWDGYRANHDRIASALGHVRNGVVLTGDVHRHWAGEIKENADRPDWRGVGVELVATSVTTSGDGGEDRNCGRISRILPFVRTPDVQATTAVSFVIEDRDPMLHLA